MNDNWNFNRCVEVLKGELLLLQNISSAQDKVRQSVMNREWADFDEKIAEVNHFSDEFTLLENERITLFSALKESFSPVDTGEKPFYAMISRLPMEEGRELSRLYRELKMETLKMRAMNETFMAYLSEAKTMAAAFLEAVYPARGGKMYTRKGHRVSQDLRSMVFNNRF